MCEGIMLVNMGRQTWAKGLSRAWPFLYMTTSSCGADRQVSLWSCTPTSCICGCMDVYTHAPPSCNPLAHLPYPALALICHTSPPHPRFKGVTGVHSMVSVTSGELGGRTFPATIRRGKGEQVRLGRGLLALVQARLACLWWHCMVVAWICV